MNVDISNTGTVKELQSSIRSLQGQLNTFDTLIKILTSPENNFKENYANEKKKEFLTKKEAITKLMEKNMEELESIRKNSLDTYQEYQS